MTPHLSYDYEGERTKRAKIINGMDLKKKKKENKKTKTKKCILFLPHGHADKKTLTTTDVPGTTYVLTTRCEYVSYGTARWEYVSYVAAVLHGTPTTMHVHMFVLMIHEVSREGRDEIIARKEGRRMIGPRFVRSQGLPSSCFCFSAPHPLPTLILDEQP